MLRVVESEVSETRCDATTWALVNRNTIVCHAHELDDAITRAASPDANALTYEIHASRCSVAPLLLTHTHSLGDLDIKLEREHVYPYDTTSAERVEVVLFSDFTTRHFLPFHEALATRVNTTNDIVYVLRHFFSYQEQDPERLLQLQGYGAEMVFKNMEYKAIDEESNSKRASPML